MSELTLQRFNWVDLLSLVFFARMGYIGFKLGFWQELVKLTGLLVGLVAGFRYHGLLGNWIASKTFLPAPWAHAVSLGVLLGVLYFAATRLLRLCAGWVSVSFQEKVNRWGGLAGGWVRAGLVVSVILVGLRMLPSDYLNASIEERSFSGRALARVAPALYGGLWPRLERLGLALRGR